MVLVEVLFSDIWLSVLWKFYMKIDSASKIGRESSKAYQAHLEDMDIGKRHELKANPARDANIFSKTFFAYTFSLFKRGYHTDLTEDDLWTPLEHHKSAFLGDLLQTKWEEELLQAKKCNRKPRLEKVLVKTFFSQIYKQFAVVFTFEMLSKVGQPLLLATLLKYFQKSSGVTKQGAINSGIAFCLLSFAYMFYLSHYLFDGANLGMQWKTACSSLIYRKAVRLSYTALGKSSPGQMTNLLSNDIGCFDFTFRFHNFVLLAPIITVAMVYIVWAQSGWAGIIGVATVVLTAVPHIFMGKVTAKHRKLIAKKTDERLRLIEETISGVRAIKMYVWEEPYIALVNSARTEELKSIKKSSLIRGFLLSFTLCNARIACYITMIVMVYIGIELTADKVFVFAVISQSLTNIMGWFVRGITEGLDTYESIKRIEKFLLLDELDTTHLEQHNESKDSSHFFKNAITLENVYAKWNVTHAEDTLSDLDIQFKKGSLTALIGPVGSGKSSLLHAILGELPLSAGRCRREGNISFACQEPWMFPASIKQNIIFGKPFEAERYNDVTRACSLLPDFQQLVHGDASIIGEKGCLLSGGQKARINLARAVYNEADVYLLDDPLSAVDARVGQQLFDECIMNLLRDKTRILVTHQLQYLHKADHIVVISNGKVVMQGTFLEITQSNLPYARFLEKNESSDASQGEDGTEDTKEKPKHFENFKETPRTSHKVVPAKIISEDEKENSNHTVENFAEASSKGLLEKSVYTEYFFAGSSYFTFFFMVLMMVLCQVVTSAADYWMSYWVKQEDKFRYSYTNSEYTVFPDGGNYSEADVMANGRSHNTPRSEKWDMTTEFCMYVYTGLIIVTVLFSAFKTTAFTGLAVKCSRIIHNQAFNRLIQTQIRFFDLNPTGRIMNRFSKDTGTMDELLPRVMFDLSQYILLILGAVAITVIVNYWFLILISGLLAVFFVMRKIYLKTSKDIKRLEGICKSPILVHLSATLQGLPSVRAYNAKNILTMEFDRHQDLYTSTCYIFNCSSHAFVFYVDLLLSAVITGITFTFLLVGDEFAGAVGLAISQIISITTRLQVGIRHSSELENYMMTVERMLEYKHLDMEPNLETNEYNKAPPGWPIQGLIKLQDMSIRHVKLGPPVLRNINVTINPGEKIGIVGRTGAGKSSLILALFRLVHVEGTILIDGLDTRDISLRDIRRNISIIPQDPFLFSGTLRKNLDPFDEYKDEELWNVLEDVEMKKTVHDNNGLSMKVVGNGVNLSVGQKQLLCLARAILKHNQIIVLDEATANVDPKTDLLIQNTIRKKFASCTVLTVAHRLHTVMDSDKIMVLERGNLMEYGHPHVLLQNTEGMFYSLVYKTGHIDQLSHIAFQSYCSLSQMKIEAE